MDEKPTPLAGNSSVPAQKSKYSADDIKVLEGMEAVRKRPAMYIGDTGIRGLHHLISEIVDNSIDEALAGHCSMIRVTIKSNGYVEVEDNGRGIPFDLHPTEKKPALEVVLTILHAGGKFENKAYAISGGLHGVGASVVNALSEHLIATVKRDGKIVSMDFSRGRKLHDLKETGSTEESGTIISFKPDIEVFKDTEFDKSIVLNRLRELAYLNKGITITLEDERDSFREELHYSNGIVEFLEHTEKKPLHKIIYLEADEGGELKFEIAFCFAERYQPMLMSYTNNIHTIEGGTHVSGFRTALTRVVNEYAERNKFLKETDNERFQGDDILEGVSSIISVMVKQPQFEGQTKTKLGNAEVKSFVEKKVYEKVLKYLDENPSIAKVIVARCIQAFSARVAAQHAKDLVRAKKSISAVLPGKLADCMESDPDKTELFIVEGDSAGGTARQGRNREFQAILPLKGKILNVEKASITKMLNNDEINALISAIGTSIDEQFNVNNRRYSKIVIMTDADVDGAHIRTLLLTFFYRNMKPLIGHGHVFIAQPPLFRAKKGKFEKYFYSDNDLEKFLKENGNDYHVQHYKGLGEMNAEQLWETTMDPEKRTLLKVTIHDSEKADELFTILMGEKVEPRKDFIISHAREVRNLDI